MMVQKMVHNSENRKKAMTSISVRASITDCELIQAVSELGEKFETDKNFPALQLYQIEQAERALRKIRLQLKWWHLTKDCRVNQAAFQFLSDQIDLYGKIDLNFGSHSDTQWINELLAAKIIVRVRDGYKESICNKGEYKEFQKQFQKEYASQLKEQQYLDRAYLKKSRPSQGKK